MKCKDCRFYKKNDWQCCFDVVKKHRYADDNACHCFESPTPMGAERTDPPKPWDGEVVKVWKCDISTCYESPLSNCGKDKDSCQQFTATFTPVTEPVEPELKPSCMTDGKLVCEHNMCNEATKEHFGCDKPAIERLEEDFDQLPLGADGKPSLLAIAMQNRRAINKLRGEK